MLLTLPHDPCLGTILLYDNTLLHLPSPHILRALLEYFKILSLMSHHALHRFYRFCNVLLTLKTLPARKGLTK
ncbi:hypothetical protein P692DRAFT_20359045 [Suillus brevipes Sb2]|nr:hypothetical protein P692DRAFT_20359045 [Suillus brevipes Sb2]